MSLHLILGPMFAGKTTRINEILSKYNGKSLNINYIKNYRYNKNINMTHNGKIINSNYHVSVLNLNDILISELFPYYNKSQLIIIDECQFYKDLKDFVINAIYNDKKNIICSGLNGDSNQELFGNTYQLLPYINKIDFLKSKCECGKDAIYSYKIIKNNKQLEIGGNDMYKPLCNNCLVKYKL